jgi:hypothetical protein
LAHRHGFGKELGLLLATSLEIFEAVVSDDVAAGVRRGARGEGECGREGSRERKSSKEGRGKSLERIFNQ